MQALVRTCVELSADGQTCIREVWAAAPTFLPPLSTQQAGEILTHAALVLGVAWAWKKLGQLTAR